MLCFTSVRKHYNISKKKKKNGTKGQRNLDTHMPRNVMLLKTLKIFLMPPENGYSFGNYAIKYHG